METDGKGFIATSLVIQGFATLRAIENPAHRLMFTPVKITQQTTNTFYYENTH